MGIWCYDGAMQKENVRVTTYVTKDEQRALRLLAVQQDTTVTALVRDLIRAELTTPKEQLS